MQALQDPVRRHTRGYATHPACPGVWPKACRCPVSQRHVAGDGGTLARLYTSCREGIARGSACKRPDSRQQAFARGYES